MKKSIIWILIGVFGLTSCGTQNSSVTNLNAEGFAKKITEASVVVLDVRSAGEFSSGHLANAMNIDVEGMQFSSEISKLDKTKSYAVYCHSGRRSAIAVGIMEKSGFHSLFNLEGGIAQWQATGHQVTA